MIDDKPKNTTTDKYLKIYKDAITNDEKCRRANGVVCRNNLLLNESTNTDK